MKMIIKNIFESYFFGTKLNIFKIFFVDLKKVIHAIGSNAGLFITISSLCGLCKKDFYDGTEY